MTVQVFTKDLLPGSVFVRPGNSTPYTLESVTSYAGVSRVIYTVEGIRATYVAPSLSTVLVASL